MLINKNIYISFNLTSHPLPRHFNPAFICKTLFNFTFIFHTSCMLRHFLQMCSLYNTGHLRNAKVTLDVHLENAIVLCTLKKDAIQLSLTTVESCVKLSLSLFLMEDTNSRATEPPQSSFVCRGPRFL